MSRGHPDWLPRIPYWERDPDIQYPGYEAASVAPHGITTRFSYTTPSGRQAYIDLVSVEFIRRSSPTAKGSVVAYVQFVPSGGSANTIVRLDMLNGVVDTHREEYEAQPGWVDVGDQVLGQTLDESTGGTVDYLLRVKLLEIARQSG